MTSIGERAFIFCSNLTSVKIADGVKEIGKEAFEECTNLKSVNIPSSVTTIGDGAFRGCTNLTGAITIPKGVTKISDYVFWGCGLTGITIPDTVTEIGEFAFFNCSLTGDVVIPASVTKIGKSAFAHNYGLLSVTFDDTEGWYNCAGSYPWAEIESKEIDVSDSSKNVLELTSQDPYTWGNLGIYKKTN